MFLLQQVSVFPLIFLMAFIRIWVSTTWVWFCEGWSCQFLAKKGENKGFVVRRFVNQESVFSEKSYKDVVKNVLSQLWLLCLCDLCPEL